MKKSILASGLLGIFITCIPMQAAVAPTSTAANSITVAPAQDVVAAKKNKGIADRLTAWVRKTFAALGKKLQYKPIKFLSIEEIEEALVNLKRNNDYFLIEKYLLEGIKKCSDQERLAALRLELAQNYLDLRHDEKAATIFAEFADLYPNSPQASYALYQAITIAAKYLLSPDRDQGRTKELLDRVRNYLANTDVQRDATYVADVREIEQRCLKNLQMAEVLTFYYYLNNGALSAAQKRLEYLKKEYLPQLPAIDAELMVLEYELAFARQDTALADQITQALKTKHPSHGAAIAKKKRWSVQELL
ncbi:outer membrane protein assembly factor BamD [Candidatus Dependentiae bacterium]|nr:outer membrane protein assembly factor BamD [Candidatus Dependentiae bacterium]